MRLLFWTINRKHMYILQSKVLFSLFLHVIFRRSALFCRVKRVKVMIEVLRSRGYTRCQMITGNKILKSAMDFGCLFIYVVYFPVLRKEPT